MSFYRMANSVHSFLPILPLQCIWLLVKVYTRQILYKNNKEVRSVREIITPRSTKLV